MQRYFISECSLIIEQENKSEIYYHLSRVLRAKTSDHVEFCDFLGNCYEYKISSITSDVMTFERQGELLSNNELENKLVLAVSFLKNNNFELVIQKAVEIGVTDIVAFESSRTVIKSSNFNNKKFSRFEKIILEASEQSKRNVVPRLHIIGSVKELVAFDCDSKFLAYEACSTSGDNLLINKVSDATGDVMVVIGPEGGFSVSEVELMSNSDFEVVSLGKRILRAETAAINACSIISAIMERRGR